MMINEKILKSYNTNHEDDVFKKSKKSNRKSLPGKKANASAIANELFETDSEKDISLHSARTPITAFFNNRNQTKDDFDKCLDDENEENIPSNDNPAGYVLST